MEGRSEGGTPPPRHPAPPPDSPTACPPLRHAQTERTASGRRIDGFDVSGDVGQCRTFQVLLLPYDHHYGYYLSISYVSLMRSLDEEP